MASVAFLVFTVLHLCHIYKGCGGCTTKPWRHGIINEDLLRFDCSYSNYIECENPDALKYNNLDFKSCGTIVNCSRGSTRQKRNEEQAVLTGFIIHLNYLIKATKCGLKNVDLGTDSDVGMHHMHLDLEENRIGNLFDIILPHRGYTRVHSVNLSYNMLETISSFPNSMHGIRVADFSSNSIHTLQEGCFKKLWSLRWISLARNLIVEVPKLVIHNRSEVTILLNENHIETIRDKAFEDLLIELLDLSDNILSLITEFMFIVKRVDTVLLKNNRITDIQEGSFAKTEMSRIDLSGNFLKAVGKYVFSNLQNLKSLLLKDNKIRWLSSPGAFDNCSLLEHLDLSNNLLIHIPSGTFRTLPKLRNLLLSSNKISTIGTHSFNDLTLDFLQFSDNPMRTLDKRWFKSTRVTRIDASSCGLLHFPLETVRILGEGLKDINLSRNSIRRFPSVNLDRDIHVERLDLSYNSIDLINCSWLGDTLRYLLLDSNAITHIERCPFTERMFSLTRVTLIHNPLECCKLQWLHNILVQANTLLSPNLTTCTSYNGQYLLSEAPWSTEECVSTTDSNVVSCEGGGNIVAAVLVTLLGLMILQGIVGAMVYAVRRKRAKKAVARHKMQACELNTISKPDSALYETVQDQPSAPVTYDQLQHAEQAQTVYENVQ